LTGEGASLVQETAAKTREHRLRVLEHQARMAGARAAPPRSEAQGRIPLLAEVKPAAVEKPARAGRSRAKSSVKQARFEGL
jgi:hypothetical protein